MQPSEQSKHSIEEGGESENWQIQWLGEKFFPHPVYGMIASDSEGDGNGNDDDEDS